MPNGNQAPSVDGAAPMPDVGGIIAVLPGDDAVAAVRRITEALHAIDSAATVAPLERFDAIGLLETSLVEHTRSLLHEYLETTRHLRQRESDLWTSAHRGWQSLAAAYAHCMAQHGADASAAANFPRRVCALRIVRALRRQLQWMRVRYLPPPDALWQSLAEVYAQTEVDGVAGDLEIYPGEHTTLQREFLKLLALAILSGDNLMPREHALVAFLINRYAGNFVLSKTPDVGCTHYFDLKHPQAPRQIGATLPADAHLRYFGVGASIAAVEGLLHALEHKQEVPAALGLKTPMDPLLLTPVLTQIYLEWSGEKLERHQQREEINKRLSVVPGFKQLIGALEQTSADPLDFTALPGGESWIANDRSDNGFGVVMPAVIGDWVSVGSIVGIENEAVGLWSVGIVRRVRRLQEGQQHIGIEVLCRNAQAVRVMRESPLGRNIRITQRMPIDRGVLLTTDAPAQKTIELLVSDPALYGAGNVHVLAGECALLVRLAEVLEVVGDCSRVRCTVLSVET